MSTHVSPSNYIPIEALEEAATPVEAEWYDDLAFLELLDLIPFVDQDQVQRVLDMTLVNSFWSHTLGR